MFKSKHILLAVIITAVFTFTASCFYFLSPTGYNRYDPVLQAKMIIKDRFVRTLSPEEEEALNDAAIEAMVKSLSDQYSFYLNTQDLEDFAEEKKEVYRGLGISVHFDTEAETMTVVAPYEGSPAEKAGILPGDVICQVDDIRVSLETYDAVLSYIKEGEKDDFTLIVRRGDETLTLSAVREEVTRLSVTHEMFRGRIGYIRISEFIQHTEADFKAALSDLKDRGMRGLIIDLRSNPGGYAETVLRITDSLLPKGVIAYLEDKDENREYFYSDADHLDMPMAVLINEGTASASELLAGSLKAYKLATVIGQKSYGKAVGQSVFPVTDTTALYLTNARYFTPNGECIDGVGIEPDILVELPREKLLKLSILAPEEDDQLEKAMEVLLGELGE